MLESMQTLVPHLATALTGPVPQLEKTILDNQTKIESFFRQQWQLTPPPLYASVDLRNAGFKIAPVDTNLFPAGFNNLNPDFMSLCVHAMQSTLARLHPSCQKILLIPESHTRNQFYLESLHQLHSILTQAGYETRIGSLKPDLTEAVEIKLNSGRQVKIEPIERQGDKVTIKSFCPCLVILNHDMSEGTPQILKDIKQTLIPPLAIGWAYRKKSQHFKHYQQVAEEFSEILGMDSWLINPLYRQCGEIDFMSGEGELCLTDQVDAALATIKQKYQTYGIKKDPFVVVKADQGTYGMGVMMVRSSDELRGLNRKARTRMSVSKGGQKIKNVILQEGVYSFETIGEQQAVAEPVVYMIGRYVVGGFYRVHTKRGEAENLNAPGMHFEPLAFAESCTNPKIDEAVPCSSNRFYAYGVIARLALLASARELAMVLGKEND
ncbi:MAG: glutamate--cysteine ligase [Pseudomonadota bacterium]